MMKDVPAPKKFLEIKRHYTKPGQSVFDTVIWVSRNVIISDKDGKDVYRQEDVEFPWIFGVNKPVNITASKYFATINGVKENSIKQLITRVVETTCKWATNDGMFEQDPRQDQSGSYYAFRDELTYILLNQIAAFNSPVWFNLGVKGRRQAASACYIQSVEDTMESIRELYQSESILFGDGSGSGTNFSNLRGAGESLSGGGASSGPMAFIQGLDAASGAIKSGGKTRRAAKMVILNDNHPDIEEFINTKSRSEDMAATLVAAGFNGEFNDPDSVYGSLPFQNANNSVRVTDAFMEAVEEDEYWVLKPRKGGPVVSVKARELWRKIAVAAHRCGDPGLQFDTTINNMHTCPSDGRINASNPCSEYMFLDDSACNLASINLMKFNNGMFDFPAFCHVVDVMITAMESFVGNADYPTDKIKNNSLKFGPLGLGYANLGALIMSKGHSYDSDDGRLLATNITSYMCSEACSSKRYVG